MSTTVLHPNFFYLLVEDETRQTFHRMGTPVHAAHRPPTRG